MRPQSARLSEAAVIRDKEVAGVTEVYFAFNELCLREEQSHHKSNIILNSSGTQGLVS